MVAELERRGVPVEALVLIDIRFIERGFVEFGEIERRSSALGRRRQVFEKPGGLAGRPGSGDVEGVGRRPDSGGVVDEVASISTPAAIRTQFISSDSLRRKASAAARV